MERIKAIEILREMVRNRVVTYDLETTIRTSYEMYAVEQAVVDMQTCGYHTGEWTSVQERLPDPWETVLCALERIEDGKFFYAVDRIDEITGRFYIHDGTLDKVKYWMPLPPLPEKDIKVT